MVIVYDKTVLYGALESVCAVMLLRIIIIINYYY